MGDATSFPCLSLLSRFAQEQAHIRESIRTGDDAVFSRVTKRKQRILDDTIESCGGVLSKGDPAKGKPNKMYTSRKKCLFCELTYRQNGELVPTTFISLWSAPPGGSKGSIDWYNQPSSVCQYHSDVGLPIRSSLWFKTKTWHQVQAARKLGVPVGAEVAYGGISHPIFKPDDMGIDSRHKARWLAKLSSLSMVDWTLGTGLSPLPTGASVMSDRLVKEEMIRLSKEPRFATLRPVKETGEKNIFLTDYSDLLSRVIAGGELYTRRAPAEIKTPSIWRVARKLRRRVSRVDPKLARQASSWTYDSTIVDIGIKRAHFFDGSPQDFITAETHRAFGLKPSRFSLQESYTRRWQHLADLRSSRAYLAGQGIPGLSTGGFAPPEMPTG